jgi:hypothetical protein
MRCANAKCRIETLYFRGGSLHCMDQCEDAPAGVKRERRQLVWLCPDCSRDFVVEGRREPGEQLVRRRLPPAAVLAEPDKSFMMAA